MCCAFQDVGTYLQEKGHEVGVTTGRKRRCGWLDLALLEYTNTVNGYSGIAVTKLDILDDLPEIKVATYYKLNGQRISRYPADEAELRKVEVVYETLPGWKQSIADIRKWDDLPENAKRYILKIQDHLQVPGMTL